MPTETPPPPQPTAADAGGRGERRWGIGWYSAGRLVLAGWTYETQGEAISSSIRANLNGFPVLVTVLPADPSAALRAGGEPGTAGASDFKARVVGERMREWLCRMRTDLDATKARLAAAERDRDGLRRTAELQSREIDEPPFLADPGAAGADLPIATGSDAERAAKLQKFKDWVHNYLDAHGVPHHPPGSHGAAGCRIGDRMDWLMARLAAAERVANATERIEREGPCACHSGLSRRQFLEALRHYTAPEPQAVKP